MSKQKIKLKIGLTKFMLVFLFWSCDGLPLYVILINEFSLCLGRGGRGGRGGAPRGGGRGGGSWMGQGPPPGRGGGRGQ